MGSVISLIQVKGGVGRSTIATNLAGILSAKYPVALVDCDYPQWTSANWYVTRKVAKDKVFTMKAAKGHAELVEKVNSLAADHRYVILDGPPRFTEMTRACIILGDLCMVPVSPSAAEIWAVSDLLTTIEEAQVIRPEIDARLCWNKFRSFTRSARELSESVKKEVNLKELGTRLGFRVAYAEVLGRGLTVMEWHDYTAREEMSALADEVEHILRRK